MDNEIKPYLQTYTQKTDADLIVMHLTNSDPTHKLSEALTLKLNKLTDCRDLIKKHGSRTSVAKMLMNMHDCSRSEAYRTIQETIEVFNATGSTVGRDFHVDILLEDIKETRRMALAKGDFKTAASCDKNYLEVIEKFFGGFEAKMYEKIQPPNITYEFNPESLGIAMPENLDAEIAKVLKPKSGSTEMFDDAEIIKPPNDDPDNNGDE